MKTNRVLPLVHWDLLGEGSTHIRKLWGQLQVTRQQECNHMLQAETVGKNLGYMKGKDSCHLSIICFFSPTIIALLSSSSTNYTDVCLPCWKGKRGGISAMIEIKQVLKAKNVQVHKRYMQKRQWKQISPRAWREREDSPKECWSQAVSSKSS